MLVASPPCPPWPTRSSSISSRAAPRSAAELLAEALGVALPAYTEARLASIDLTQIQPAEYRADVVVLLLDGGVPIRVLIVEVQLGVDHGKRFTWPEYSTGARAVHRCPVGLLVVAPDPTSPPGAREPIETGIPGFVLRPPVLGREAVPVVTDPAEAARRPELARALRDGARRGPARRGDRGRGAARGAAAWTTSGRVSTATSCYNSLNEAARRALEAMMKGYEYQSDFAKKYVAQGRGEGRAEEARALCSPRSGFAASRSPTPRASASWRRRIRSGWSAGSRRPSSRRRWPTSSTSRAEPSPAGASP